MDTLQSRFRDRTTEILQQAPTITMALGRGDNCLIETCYVVGTSEELYCIVKPTPALVKAVQDDAQVVFTANHGFPKQMLQGRGRAFFLGGVDRYPDLREQMLSKIPDALAFLTTIRNLGVLKILPDQIALTDDGNLGLGPRPVYFPEAAHALPERRRRWLQAMSLSSWPLALIPVGVAALLAPQASVSFSWWLLALIMLIGLLVHVGTLLLTADRAFRRRLERREALGTKVLLDDGLLASHQVWTTGVACVGAAVLLGFLVGMGRDTSLLIIGLLGGLAALWYSGWPVYAPPRRLEDVAVFAGYGPLLTIGTYQALVGSVHLTPCLVSLPLGGLATAIIQACHLETFSADTEAKRHTLAVVLGWERARQLFVSLLALPYALMALLILTGALPTWTWLTFLSAPITAWAVWSVWRTDSTAAQTVDGIERWTTWAYVTFGILLLCGLLFA